MPATQNVSSGYAPLILISSVSVKVTGSDIQPLDHLFLASSKGRRPLIAALPALAVAHQGTLPLRGETTTVALPSVNLGNSASTPKTPQRVPCLTSRKHPL